MSDATSGLGKRALVIAAAFAPLAAAAQGGATATRGMTMPAEPVVITTSIRSGEFLLDIGPMDLPARSEEHGGHHAMPEAPPLWTLVPKSGWLHGYRVDLVDKHGHGVPQTALHHVNVIATQRRELFSGIMLRVAAAGPETGTVSIPGFLGYDARAGDTLLVRTMLNPGDRSYEGVHVRVHFPYTPSDAFFKDLTISPFYMDVTPPAGGHAFDIPVGKSEWFWEAEPAIDGRIIGFSGHVHRYATLFRFEDRTAKKVIWETRPDTTADGEPKQIPLKRFLLTLGYGIRADHTYRLTVFYDNPTANVIADGGMGALGGVFRASGGVKWPSIDASDKDYRLDVWAMSRP